MLVEKILKINTGCLCAVHKIIGLVFNLHIANCGNCYLIVAINIINISSLYPNHRRKSGRNSGKRNNTNPFDTMIQHQKPLSLNEH